MLKRGVIAISKPVEIILWIVFFILMSAVLDAVFNSLK
jgi:hypothetical protein